jgi:hypothetical protein
MAPMFVGMSCAVRGLGRRILSTAHEPTTLLTCAAISAVSLIVLLDVSRGEFGRSAAV